MVVDRQRSSQGGEVCGVDHYRSYVENAMKSPEGTSDLDDGEGGVQQRCNVEMMVLTVV